MREYATPVVATATPTAPVTGLAARTVVIAVVVVGIVGLVTGLGLLAVRLVGVGVGP